MLLINLNSKRSGAPKAAITLSTSTFGTTTTNSSSPTDDSNTTAAQKVFQVAELLEHILRNVPVRQLLLLKRTSWRFKAVIDDTPGLQLELFLRPSVPDGITYRWNYLMFPESIQQEQQPYVNVIFRLDINTNFFHTVCKKYSYMRMFVTQPPPRKVVSHCKVFARNRPSQKSYDTRVEVVNESGVTFGEVFDRIVDGLRSDRRRPENYSHFGIYVNLHRLS
ncbi:auxilin-like clathrin-binding protein required for normal clathrin function [Vermiconidia calcicola]|uniref:Auxilin-like clathrin-binding protein required for normal clathrin function n=1 Tax=Vermiconidia calcicola TaxID=1690605 RepID=A0ACC3NW87_9PEZI|nr:auxilin-like clathrin-binding protein required for normal clathrin function [Vermiconidia calcicola]